MSAEASNGSSSFQGSMSCEKRSTSCQNEIEQSLQDTSSEQSSDTVNQRPRRSINKPTRYRDENFVTTYSCYFAGPMDEDEPSCYEEAKDSEDWQLAMDEEMKALMKNETWDLVPRTGSVCPITCKWVYKLKRKADGSIDRFKARLVAHGFSQKYGEDFEETFSPVAIMTSVRTLISLAASQGWKLW